MVVRADIDMKKVDSLNQLIGKQSGIERIETLIMLSDMYRKLSPDQSLKTDTIAINYADQEGLDNMKGIILLSMGRTASISGDYSLALDYFNKAVEALDKTDNHKERCRAYINRGIVEKNLGNFNAALENFDVASDIAAENNVQDQLASSLTNRAIVYFSSGDYNKAAENYQLAMDIYKVLNDSTRYAVLTMNLGLVYWQWNKNDLALKMLLEAKDVLEQTNKSVELAKLYNNLGRLYSQDLGDNNKALEYYQRSLEMRELIGNQVGIAIVLANMGRIYSDMKTYDKAVDHLKRSQNISKMIGYKEGEALAYYYLGQTFKTRKQFQTSNSYMDSTLMIAKEHGFNAYFRLVNEAKLTNYFKMQDDSAFVKEYNVFAYSYDSTINALSELKFEYNNLQNETLANQEKLNDFSLQIENQSATLNAYRIALALLLLFFVTTLFLWLKKRN